MLKQPSSQIQLRLCLYQRASELEMLCSIVYWHYLHRFLSYQFVEQNQSHAFESSSDSVYNQFCTWFLLAGACSTLAVHWRCDKWSVLCMRNSCTRGREYHRRGHVHRQYTPLFHVHEEEITQRIWHTSICKRVQFWSEWRRPHWLKLLAMIAVYISTNRHFE